MTSRETRRQDSTTVPYYMTMRTNLLLLLIFPCCCVSAALLDWDIEPWGMVEVTDIESEIIFRYDIPGLQQEGAQLQQTACTFQVLNYDCALPTNSAGMLGLPQQPNEQNETQAGSAVYASSADTTQPGRLTGGARIDAGSVADSEFYYDIPEDPYRGSIKFCARVDCGLLMDDNEGGGSISNTEMLNSVNFHETKMTVTFDLVSGFAIKAQLTGDYSKYKHLHSYKLHFCKCVLMHFLSFPRAI